MNDGIEGESCSLKYIYLDEVTDEIVKSGKGTELAQNGHRKCLPHGPSTSWRQTTVGSIVGWKNLL